MPDETTAPADHAIQRLRHRLAAMARSKSSSDYFDTCRRLLVSDPMDIDAASALAEHFAFASKPIAAGIAYRRLCLSSPGDAEGWFRAGHNFLSGKHRDDAVRSFRRVLTIDPSHTQALVSVAGNLCRAELNEERPNRCGAARSSYRRSTSRSGR